MTRRDEELDLEYRAKLDEPEPECPACGGSGGELGSLGALRWFRCRACGIDFNLRGGTQ